jgi:hypothetical protein
LHPDFERMINQTVENNFKTNNMTTEQLKELKARVAALRGYL